MRHKYEAIVAGGFEVQIDCPDLAMGRHIQYANLELSEFRKRAGAHVEALNQALANIPPERARIHICWGNYEGPHHRDVPLGDIIDIVFSARPSFVLFEAANPRHAHEWALFETVKLPAGKILIHTTSLVASPRRFTAAAFDGMWECTISAKMGPEGEAHAILDWLTGGAIKFASLGAVYDTIHFPGDFVVQFARPQAALQLELEEKFPGSSKDIVAFFAALAEAGRAGRAIFAQRAMPSLLANVYGMWHQREIRKWWGRTSAEVLDELVSDPKLRAVLLAQRANYGGTTATEISFGVHALIMRHYFNGAYYRVGGAKVFAEALIPVIEKVGGAIRLKAKVQEFLVENGTVAGVRLEDATQIRAPRVFGGTSGTADDDAKTRLALPAIDQARRGHKNGRYSLGKS